MDERSDTKQTTETSPETQQPAAADDVAELRSQLEAQGRKLDEIARAYAEVLNERDSFRRRIERERERQVEGAKADAASGLFDALDELQRALQAGGQDAASVLQGVKMIADNVQRRVEGMGITRIGTVGHFFDPNVHEAIDLAPTPDRETDGKVIEETRAGWKLGERVVRAARVRVARYVPQAESADTLPS